MKRITLNNFSAGIVNASDPMLIPDNACVEMENYEFRDGLYPRKRKSVSVSELNDYPFDGIIRSIAVWFPRYMPSGADSDKVYVVHGGNKISLLWIANGVFTQQDIFTDIPDDAEVTFFASYDKVLVADNANMGRYISVNKDNEIESGILGIEAPTAMAVISNLDADNKYADIDDADTGMTIERGSILQYCYTVEDKYGAESNPSPVITSTDMMFKYPDSTTTAGFKYYWKSATIKNLSVAQYSAAQRKTLKYVNLYRREIDFLEGTIGSSFRMVKRIPLSGGNILSTVDSSSANLQDLSYDKGVCPASPQMIETNDIVYLAGAKAETLLFPFKFDKYCEITITNNNGIDYVEPIIAMRWTAAMVGIDSWTPYINGYAYKVRLFHSDMITPIPVVYEISGEEVKAYIKPPHITMETENKLYLAFADSSAGVDPTWRNPAHGQFCWIGNWQFQKVFGVNKPLSTKHHVCCNVPYDYSLITNKRHVVNLSAMDNPGVLSGSDWTEDRNTKQRINLFALTREIGIGAYSFSPQVLAFSTVTVDKRFMVRIGGKLATPEAQGNDSLHQILCQIGNLQIGAAHFPTANTIVVYAVLAGAELTEAKSIAIINTTNYSGYNDINFTAYISDNRIACYCQESGVSLSKTLPFNVNPNVATGDTNLRAFYYDGIETTSLHKVAKFDVIGMPELSDIEAKEACQRMTQGFTYFQEAIGISGQDHWANANISYEPKQIKLENNQNQVAWSDISGQSFSALAYKKFKEPVQAIIVAPSFMRMQYQNTIIVFTRNTISRIVLSADIKSLAADAGNVVEEYKSNGLFAPKSLVSGGGSMYWLSETGVMQWNQDTFGNLSYGIIDIPIHQNYIAVWISVNSQYLLHDKTSGISYVYHANTKAWTMFSGLEFDMYGNLDLGSSTSNKLLLGKEYETRTAFSEYPGDYDAADCSFKIKTKQFFIGNLRPIRFRGIWDKMSVPTSIKALTYNHRLSSEEIEVEALSPVRYEWTYITNGFWGEYVQILLDNVNGLTSIDIDIKEEF